MTTLDDLELFTPTTDALAVAPTPRKCRRHRWAGGVCERCGRTYDHELAARNRRSRRRGNGTSAALARYLGGVDVERRGLPWDVEAKGCRVQSKRLAARPSANAIVGFLEAIEPHVDTLRAVFYIPPRLKLTSGYIVVLYPEWIAWHGPEAHIGPMVDHRLVSMPLPAFRDWHIGPDRARRRPELLEEPA